MQRMTLVLAQMLNENSSSVPAENAPASRSDSNGEMNPSGLENAISELGNPSGSSSSPAEIPQQSSPPSGMPQLEDDLASLRSSFVSRFHLKFKC